MPKIHFLKNVAFVYLYSQLILYKVSVFQFLSLFG